MRTILATCSLMLWSTAAPAASVFEQITSVTDTIFEGLPQIRTRTRLGDVCGGDAGSGPFVRYCTSQNRIYARQSLVEDAGSEAAAIYMLAHAYGHALQVRHGIADVALARIRSDRPREAEYRGWVTRQVECFAGVLWSLSTTGQGSPAGWFADEPFTGSHWGSDPVSARAQVSIGLEERDLWFRRGRDSADFASCDVAEFSAAPVAEAAR